MLLLVRGKYSQSVKLGSPEPTGDAKEIYFAVSYEFKRIFLSKNLPSTPLQHCVFDFARDRMAVCKRPAAECSTTIDTSGSSDSS